VRHIFLLIIDTISCRRSEAALGEANAAKRGASNLKMLTIGAKRIFAIGSLG
jgi:hypothetical protein